ncbi:4-(cytidine 5'-diphospho)-2-C-methyl-D-erythritol kinase [Thioclava sp. GXIMD4215]|uniref:4-(cytidine 5'-diphospho)-2-C-methyl-D-erythritol kinase n=1 Tax=Thioclava sp. GXIMD4215 TaxID=3131928 RepID=UPI003246C289
MSLSDIAPAKVNLSLAVTGRRADGYHTLESLVVFAGFGDRLTVEAHDSLDLQVDGPFAEGVPVDARNLVLKAAHLLQRETGTTQGARIRLTKTLPHGGGIGGGSSDAAVALRLLARLWDVPAITPECAVALGADVPVCMQAPQPQIMRGIGEVLSAAPVLPECWLVLVNPRVETPTGAMFQALGRKAPAPSDVALTVPLGMGHAAFALWLAAYGNDFADVLTDPASAVYLPEITQILQALADQDGCLMQNLSGSGSTCWGVFATQQAAEAAARRLAQKNAGWWVQPAQMLS